MKLALILILAVVGLAVAVYLFFILPRISDRADTELLCAHYVYRGGWDPRLPENSLPAFATAIRADCGIVLDVRLTADNKLIVFHDATLTRMCGIKKEVSALPLSLLRQYPLKGGKEVIPTLSEVLALIDGQVPIMLIPHADKHKNTICRALVKQLDVYAGAFAILSADPSLLAWFRSYRPRYARGELLLCHGKTQSRREAWKAFAFSHMLSHVISRPDLLVVPVRRRRSLPFLLCTRLLKVKGFLWGVKDPSILPLCRKHGFYAISDGLRPSSKDAGQFIKTNKKEHKI